MAESTPETVQPLSQRMETLAALEPSPFPVISLYLSLTSNHWSREHQQSSAKYLTNALGDPRVSRRQSFDRPPSIRKPLEEQRRRGHALQSSHAVARNH